MFLFFNDFNFNPFPHSTILQQTSLNIFCQNIENLYNSMDNLWLKMENIVAKGEIARFEQFLLLSLCFQKDVSESVYMRFWVMIKHLWNHLPLLKHLSKTIVTCYEWKYDYLIEVKILWQKLKLLIISCMAFTKACTLQTILATPYLTSLIRVCFGCFNHYQVIETYREWLSR